MAVAYACGALVVWDYSSGAAVRKLALGRLPARSLVWASGQLVAGSDFGVVPAWRGDKLAFARPPRRDTRAPAVLGAGDGGKLLYLCVDREIEVWDPSAWIKLRALESLPAPASQLVWAPYTMVVAWENGAARG